MQHYCPDRAADDLDLLIEPTAEAGEAIKDILYGFNDAASFAPEDFAKPARHYSQKRALYLDLLTPRADERFDLLWEKATSTTVNGVAVRVADRNDLLEMKRRAVRERANEKDIRDVQLLEARAV